MTIQCTLNGKPATIEVEDDKPLLWSIREDLGLTGTKFACGVGVCGACTVMVDGNATRSCVIPTSAVRGRAVDTIEGLQTTKGELHVLQQMWMEFQVPQCGYCQPGFLMAAAALFKRKPKPTEADIAEALTNLCRCGTYTRVRAAIRAAAEQNKVAELNKAG